MFELKEEVEERKYDGRPRRSRFGTVVKVARRYCTVRFPGWPDEQYDKETGVIRGGEQYGWAGRIKRPEEWARQDRAVNLRLALRGVGVNVDTNAKLTNEQLEAIAKIVGVEV